MKLLHNIGTRINSNYNNLEEILKCNDPLSFDGIYSNVWEHRRNLRGKDITLFVMGGFMGGHNKFDHPMPFETYCDWNQVIELCWMLNAKLGYHTLSHRDLTTLDDDTVRREITPPFPMKWFAYPAGRFDSRIIRLVQEAGYEDAWSVTQGDGSRFQRRRTYLNW